MLEFDIDPDSLTELSFEQLYFISNAGPGLVPSVIIDIHVPQETSYNIVKFTSIQVKCNYCIIISQPNTSSVN